MSYTERCGNMDKVRVHIADNQMTGYAEGGGTRKYNVAGSISDNGSFRGSFAANVVMTGQFTGDTFQSEPWNTANCGKAWMKLQRVK